MRPVDPRLLRESYLARRWLVAVAVAGLLNGLLAIALALVLSRVLSGAVQGRIPLAGVETGLALVAGLALGRGAMMWVAEYAGHVGARHIIAALRSRLLRTLATRGPADLETQRTGALVTAVTGGIEALDVYFARYLPQLVLGAAIPTMALIFLAVNDALSALIVLITLPLIPLFMWLIGSTAQHRVDQRWSLLQRLGAYYLDVIQGLPTLRIFGRADAQVERVRVVTEASRRATMGTLSIAFLSAMVLEILSSIATALVAAEIGLRLVDGTMTLQAGLAVLVLVPEAYLPLRQLGTFFHSSMEGVSAASTIYALIGEQDGSEVPRIHVSPASGEIVFSGVTCLHGERGEGLQTPLTFTAAPRTTTLLTGGSGEGKTTALGLLVPILSPTSGTIRVDGVSLARIDPQGWRKQTGWVSQHPALFPGTVLDNLRIGAPQVTDVDARALLARLFPEASLGLGTVLTPDGEGVSGGERVRIALARAMLRAPALLLLDEPTAFLDPESRRIVVDLLEELAETTTLIIATHESDLFSWANHVVDVGAQPARVPGERVG